MWSKWPGVTRIAEQREPWDASASRISVAGPLGSTTSASGAPRSARTREQFVSSGPSGTWSTTTGTTRVYGRYEVSLLAEARYGCPVESWDITTIAAPGGTVAPTVLTTDDGARAIAIRLEAGQVMNDHQVRERAWVVGVEGRAAIRCGDQVVDGGVGTLVTFEPGERHAVSSENGARLLLILAPWPGPGHYLDGAS